ncbi:MAG: hypothetical protein ACXWXN_09920 [Actinomycetota bacterium]
MTAEPRSSSAPLLMITAALAIGAGLVIAALLLVSTGRSGDAPKGPFLLGSTAGLREEVEKSPVYIADPTGGDGLWLELRGKELVALSAVPPGNPDDCTVRWRDSVGAYEDCDGERYDGDQLAMYPLEPRDGSLYVDTRRVVEPSGG